MQGHETMTIEQAIFAIMHTVGTVIAREIAAIITVCTGRYLQPFSSIVAKNFLEVRITIWEPFLYDCASGALSLLGCPCFFSISRIVELNINIFGVVGFCVLHFLSF
jgi:hypothetical protein